MPLLSVYTLDKLVCRINAQPGWTGGDLKEAIEVETDGDFLVCTQRLAVNTTMITHETKLDDVIAGDADISVSRLPCPDSIRYPDDCASRRMFGMALRPLEMFPVIAMEYPLHGYLLSCSTGQQWETMESLCQMTAGNEENEDQHEAMRLHHVGLNFLMLSTHEWIPWREIAGVDPGDVAAVLALQSSCTFALTGNVSWMAAVLLLEEGGLLAVTSWILEECHLIDYAPLVTSAACRASSWGELSKLVPGFAAAMSEPANDAWARPPNAFYGEPLPIGPLRIAAPEALGSWTSAQLQERLQLYTGDPHRFALERLGLPSWPAKRFAAHPAPADVLGALSAANVETDIWKRNAEEIDETCGAVDPPMIAKGKGGKGKGTLQCQEPFSVAMAQFRERLAGNNQFLERLHALEEAVPADRRSYDFWAVSSEALQGFQVEMVFGKGQWEVMYDVWEAQQLLEADG